MSGSADEAKELRATWDRLGGSDYRDFFIASHLGWDDPVVRERQAEADAALVFSHVADDAARPWHVLEIGCGVGRLSLPVQRRVRSYTGIDISPTMIAEARRRVPETAACRFLVSDGTSVPPEARDRQYDMAFAMAVLIHCPLSVVTEICHSAMQVLRDGGDLRLQLLADPDDVQGISVTPQTADVESAASAVESSMGREVAPLLSEAPYVGHRFTFDSASNFLRDLGGSSFFLRRFDKHLIYGLVKK